MAEDEEVYGGEMAEEQLEMDELHEEPAGGEGAEGEASADDVSGRSKAPSACLVSPWPLLSCYVCDHGDTNR